MTLAEESYEYYVRVVSDVIQSARNRGVAIHSISLSGFNLPRYKNKIDKYLAIVLYLLSQESHHKNPKEIPPARDFPFPVTKSCFVRKLFVVLSSMASVLPYIGNP
jgi:hypothetical protein